MQLQGRNLSIEMQGDDIRLLQSELRQLALDIPDEESQEAFFGPGTREVVIGFQEANRLEPTGVADEGTAALINARVEARRPMVGRGQVRQPDGSPFASAPEHSCATHLCNEKTLSTTIRWTQLGNRLQRLRKKLTEARQALIRWEIELCAMA
jgi:peptidoglycan hydrolase-like protein with peptidoglycan-binding domain